MVRVGFYLFLIFCVIETVSCYKFKEANLSAPGKRLQNVQYGIAMDTAGRKEALLMDIDLPAGAAKTSKYPLMIMIHGGGFTTGDKSDLTSHCSIFADSGFVCASINYRLGWRTGKQKCEGDTLSEYFALYRAVQDANTALHYLISNSKQYDIDTNCIFIGGGSAGSSIALYTALLSNEFAETRFTNEYKSLGPVTINGNTMANNPTIKGILNMWGALGDSTLITPANAVPVISFHGTADASTPYDIGYEYMCTSLPHTYGSACISRRLAAYRVPYILHLKSGAPHAPKAYKPEVVVPLAVQFFKDIMKEKSS